MGLLPFEYTASIELPFSVRGLNEYLHRLQSVTDLWIMAIVFICSAA
jgi:hypothetical protein